MARTELFRKIRRMMKAAQRANRLNLNDSQLSERIEEDQQRLINRRRFLQDSMLAAAATAPLISVFRNENVFAALPNTLNDVAIIGAGAAGLAAAYQLKKNKISFDLYEASPTRVGGRIYTSANFNSSGQFIELGAELVDSDHDALIGLAKEVMGPSAIQDFAGADSLEGDMFYFGGQLRTEKEFIAGVRPLLAQIEKDNSAIYEGLNPDDATIEVDWSGTNTVREIDAMSVGSYLEKHKSLMEDWIHQALIVAYTGDMGVEVDRQSAINLVDSIDTDPDKDGFFLFGGDESKRVRGGSGQLIAALKHRTFTPNDRSATLHNGHSLVEIVQNGVGSHFRLTFKVSGSQRFVTKFYSQVIIAIPGTILREVKGLSHLDIDPLIKRQIAELVYGTNTKIMMSYEQRFWREGLNGRPKNEGSIYMDLGSQNYWETSRRQNGTMGILTNFLGGNAGLAASKETVAKAQADLATVYGSEIPKSKMNRSVVMNWNTNSLVKASYSCPGPGQFTSIWGRMNKPQLKGRLIFAGEHTSTSDWGFMNGGYESGIRAAAQVVESRKRRIRLAR